MTNVIVVTAIESFASAIFGSDAETQPAGFLAPHDSDQFVTEGADEVLPFLRVPRRHTLAEVESARLVGKTPGHVVEHDGQVIVTVVEVGLQARPQQFKPIANFSRHVAPGQIAFDYRHIRCDLVAPVIETAKDAHQAQVVGQQSLLRKWPLTIGEATGEQEIRNGIGPWPRSWKGPNPAE
jgi:hypothetical protein